MLKQRVITALVLLAILLPTLFMQQPQPFIVIALVMLSAGGWEWGRLCGLPAPQSVAAGLGLGSLLLAVWLLQGVQLPTLVWAIPAVVWVLGGAGMLRMGVEPWGRLPASVKWPCGVMALAFAWLAMAAIRSQGVNLLLSVFVLVWAADVFAYFGGRAFGKRKLAPTISPGKSWAGVYTGMLGVGAVAWVWMQLDARYVFDSPSLYTLLFQRYGWWMPLLVAGLAAMSVVGDLVESLVKRSAGMKDSSNLLPGHGGVLDRIDALLPVLPLTMLLLSGN